MATPEAIFIGANRQTQVSDFNKKRKIVAFGAGKTIALWRPLDPTNRGVFATLKGHKSEVTCIRFFQEADMMVSTSEDFQVRIWKFVDEEMLECVQTIEYHKHSITSLAVLEQDLFVIGCADGSVSLWSFKESEFHCTHEFYIQKGVLPLTLSLIPLLSQGYMLAIGGTNKDVFIYSFTVSEGCSKDFTLAAKLEGHEDWIKSLDFFEEFPGDIMLASGSQDRYIRLWRIRTNNLIDNSDEDDSKLKLLSNKQYKFNVTPELKVAINFEALIIGHDDWISSLKWHESKRQLLASTADTAVMIWEQDEISGVWVCASRLGELSSKGASTATGSSGGFWSCLWFSDSDSDFILTNGKTGSWRMWTSSCSGIWEQALAVTGFGKSVTDIAWAPNGEYLLATSLDQTTRLFSQWKNGNGKKRELSNWFEFSRPQIHGYDMICVEPITNTRFISGGDEKILRSFDEPKGVAQLLNKFANIQLENESEMPESASLPALGLSSKATNREDIDEEEDPDARETDDVNNISFDVVSSLQTPPLEDELQRHTLWPEIEKLYGHGYEISCLDVSPDKKLVASACKSNNLQHAVIRITDTDTWLQLKPTSTFHNLTITRLRFSKDNTYLLSVSRDRQWAVWKRNMNDNSFDLAYKNVKAHTRIIWDADWAPLEFGQVFVTSSRDRTIKTWRFSEEKNDFILESSVKVTEPVTSLAVHDKAFDGKMVIAAGLESGAIMIYSYDSSFAKIHELSAKITPADKINRLRWSRLVKNGNLLLGVASSDHSARIYSIANCFSDSC